MGSHSIRSCVRVQVLQASQTFQYNRGEKTTAREEIQFVPRGHSISKMKLDINNSYSVQNREASWYQVFVKYSTKTIMRQIKKNKVTLSITSYTAIRDRCKVYHLSTQSPFFFQRILWQAFWSHLPRKFSVVIRSHVSAASLTLSSTGNLHPRDNSLVVQTRDNPMKLGPHYMGRRGVAKFKFQLPWWLQRYLPRNADERYSGAKELTWTANFSSCCCHLPTSDVLTPSENTHTHTHTHTLTHTHTTGSQLAVLQRHSLTAEPPSVLTPSEHTLTHTHTLSHTHSHSHTHTHTHTHNRITARYSTTAQFDSWAAFFQAAL